VLLEIFLLSTIKLLDINDTASYGRNALFDTGIVAYYSRFYVGININNVLLFVSVAI